MSPITYDCTVYSIPICNLNLYANVATNTATGGLLNGDKLKLPQKTTEVAVNIE
jgi:hypothetical protein